MKVEILYFDGCPTYLEAKKALRGVLEEQGVDAAVELVAVNTDEEAQELRFAGSPTIRVDGEDLFPVPERAEYVLGCRMYATSEGLRGSPTSTMLSEALAKKQGGSVKEAFRDSVLLARLPCVGYIPPKHQDREPRPDGRPEGGGCLRPPPLLALLAYQSPSQVPGLPL